jgi:hypothetical protein
MLGLTKLQYNIVQCPIGKKIQILQTIPTQWLMLEVILKGKKPMQWFKSLLAVARCRIWTFSFANEMDERKLSFCNFKKLVA